MKIKLDRAKRIIHVAQISCIDTLLDRFPRYKANLARYAPLPKKIEKSSDTESPLSACQPYQALMGALLWLAGSTRPGIAFSLLSVPSHFQPHRISLAALVGVVPYLSHIRTLGLTLGGGKEGVYMYTPTQTGRDAQTPEDPQLVTLPTSTAPR